MSLSPSAHVRAVRRLYRDVLALHRRLPEEFRQLGNTYARDEFRRHKTAKSEFVAPFMKEWTLYVETMRQQLSAAPADISPQRAMLGAPLDMARAKSLSDEQLGQLYELKQEIHAQNGKGTGSAGAHS